MERNIKMAKENKDIKTFNMRMPKDMWMFLKMKAADQEVSMTDIIVRCVGKYKRKFENKLTESDTSV
jgi:predicted HicB family RNase H-like nuclease